MIVKLTPDDLTACFLAAGMRHVSNIDKPQYNGLPEGKEVIDRNTDGCIGEFAVARLLNLHWHMTKDDKKSGDVGNIVEVRSVTRPKGKSLPSSLILHKKDVLERPFVLAIFNGHDTVSIPGWIFGDEGAKEDHWREADPSRGIRHAAYFVPQKILRPMEEIMWWFKTPDLERMRAKFMKETV